MGELEEKLNKILSSPADMEKIMQFARSFGGDAPGKDKQSEPDIDPALLKKASKLMREYGDASGGKQALLSAMRPFLREEHRGALDTAMRAVKITHIAKAALSEFSGGDDDNTVSR